MEILRGEDTNPPTPKMGHLPIYVEWIPKLKRFVPGIGHYAMEKSFHKDEPNIHVWCIPYPLYVPFFPFDNGIHVLRSCGTSEELVNILCYETNGKKWIDYFNLRERELNPCGIQPQ